jgi:NADH-quinone oxidoreductase subunit G
LVIGSFLRKDHPLLAARLRLAARSGAKISVLHATDDELLMPLANKLIAAPAQWLTHLGEIAVAIAQSQGITAPAEFATLQPSATAKQIAASLLSGEPRAIFLGNAAAQHPQASSLHAVAQWIAQNTQSNFGYLTEAANTVGGYLAHALPANGGNALAMFAKPRKAYVLLHAEPELDCYDAHAARVALYQAEMVIALSPFAHGAEYADVMLPIAPFSETAGTFINAEGRAQSFNGSVKPLGDTRPGWKVLRVLANLLELPGFEYETSEQIRTEVLGHADVKEINLSSRLNNIDPSIKIQAASASSGLQRVADVPVYFTDAIVRRSASLQQTTDAAAPRAFISTALADKLGIAQGNAVRVSQGSAPVTLTAAIDANLPADVVRIAAGHASTAALGAMFGSVSVEKA